MDAAARAAAEHDCAAVMTRFFHRLDRRDYEGVAALLTEDGVWLRQGQELAGPSAVLAALQARPAGLATRHLLGNVVVDLVGDREATVGYEVTVYAQQEGEKPRLLHVMTGEDRLQRIAAGWRIRRKAARVMFRFGD